MEILGHDVLVVDDHPASLEMMREVLKTVAGRPVLASSGPEALELLEKNQFAVALLDVQMPGMDGFEVARRIRAHPSGKQTAIIFITGHTDGQEVSARAYALGAVDFLAKPIDPQAVRAKVAVFLDLHRKTAELKRQAEMLRESEALRHENELAHERQLRQAQKLEAVAVLAAGVAHHFNNILQIILGHVETLMDSDTMQDPQRRSLEVMQRTGERGAALVQRLLVFSRRESPKVGVADVNTAVTEAAALVKPVLPTGVTCSVEQADGPVKVIADSRELELMIVNLALNSRDAMPQGGHLTIGARRGGAVPGVRAKETVRVFVSDTGHGMSEDVKQHLFEPFFTTKGPARGTGLGLATVHAIVARGGGTVRVDSEVGKGSTIEMILPAAPRTARASGKAHALNEAPTGHGETILVVEDETDLRELIVSQLEGSGYVVLEAGDGKSALAIGNDPEARIDLLLCDVIIPGGAGPEVARQLRKKRPTLRVVMMTAHDEETLRQEFGDDAPVVGLKKPFRTSDMLHRVRTALERRDKDA